MRDLLVEEGFQITLVRHVLRVRNVSRIRPNLLILDQKLDGSDAEWVLLLARGGDAGTSRIPVLVCTAHDTLVQREEPQLRYLSLPAWCASRLKWASCSKRLPVR